MDETTFHLSVDKYDPAVTELLVAARDMIEQGWTQGDYTDGEGCYCAIGACRVAVFGAVDAYWDASGERVDTYDAVTLRVIDALPEGYFSIPHYNDAPERTLEDVIDLFDRAIAARGVE